MHATSSQCTFTPMQSGNNCLSAYIVWEILISKVKNRAGEIIDLIKQEKHIIGINSDFLN